VKISAIILLSSCAFASAQNLRMIDGKIYDVSTLPPINETGAMIKVVEDTTNGTICELSQVRLSFDDFDRRQYTPMHLSDIIVKNYPDDADLVTDHLLRPVHALQTGKAQTAYGTLLVYDCGTPWTPPPPAPLTPEQIAAAKAKADAAKKSAEDKALKFNQDASAQNDPYGLLRMGERYRDGEGVAKSLPQARDYLARAAAAGNLTASNELANLPSR
jgi:hypothetical protein